MGQTNLPLEHLSISQLDMVRRCGEQYRLRYVEGIRMPPAGAMLSGGGVHEGAAARHRIRQGQDIEMPRADVVDYSVSKFDERLENEGIELRGEEKTVGKDKVIGEYRDLTAELGGAVSDLIAPQVMKPIAVEERVELDVPALDTKFLGFIDLVHVVDDVEIIEDLKSGSKKHGQDAVDGSDQLTMYALGWKVQQGRLPGQVGLRSLRKLKKGPVEDLVVGTRTDDDITKLLRIISTTARAISAGVFIPAPPGVWWCSKKWCGYWGICKYRGGK